MTTHTPSICKLPRYFHNSPSIIMEYKQSSEYFLQGVYPPFFTACNGYVLPPLQRVTQTDLSAKAKAFTIDALLNTDKPRRGYSTVSMSDDGKVLNTDKPRRGYSTVSMSDDRKVLNTDKPRRGYSTVSMSDDRKVLNTDKPRRGYSTVSMSDDRKVLNTDKPRRGYSMSNWYHTDERKDSFTEDIITSSEQQNKKDSVSQEDLITYEEFSQGLQRAHVLKHEKYQPMVLQNEPKTYYPSELLNYSPMITGGLFRPVECYSPMSSEGQSTPAGLKSIYRSPVSLDSCHYSSLSTPESKHNLTSDRYLTPKEKQNIFMEGRKLLYTRRHERPHPYLSTKHNLTPVDKTDINLPSTPEQVARVDDNRKSSKAKRNRTAFTPDQLQVLEAEFEKQQYLVGNERCDLADTLNLTVTQVKVWFQNRRIKWRKEQLEQGKH